VLLLENRLGGSFLSVNLEGPAENPLGLNANVTIWQGSKSQSKELTLTRGYLSAQPPQLHFGLREGAVDSIVVNWSDRYKSVVKNVRPNNKISIVWSAQEFATSSSTQPKFFELPNALVPHQEDNYDDFLVEPLLPHRYSRLGPIPAVSANYLYLPGAAGEAGTLYQTSTVGATAGATTVASARENFTAKLLGKPNAAYAGREEVSALFFDMDGDGDDDLYVVHGGNNAKATPDSFQDVLYRNDGGGFVETTLPSMHSSGQVVSAADYDADGDQDLFIGGRIVPGAYPQPAQSYLLENDGNGVFIDVTEPLAPELSKAGLITTAAWADFNGDARLDLAVTGEWMGVEIWLQTAAGFTKMETPAAPSGWWYALAAKDLDGDDDLDLLVGNLGRNYKYQADESHRFEVYANDFDENGHNDIVLAKAGEEGHRLPLRGRECSSEQIPAIAQRFETYAAFADADLEDIYGAQMLNTSLHYAVEEFGHHWLENQGDATFVPHLLPASTQLSSINAIEEIDYNQDEHSDYLLAGNLLYAEVETPRNDGGYGIVLLGGSEGPAGVVRPEESGFFLEGEIRAITTLRQGRKTYLMIARNNAPWQIFNEAP
ncbi:MAG: FG-GAP-like repeat-containing protein, partial [Bacteroidota bacterium]